MNDLLQDWIIQTLDPAPSMQRDRENFRGTEAQARVRGLEQFLMSGSRRVTLFHSSNPFNRPVCTWTGQQQ
jgi:hypothetical protein